jgi:hypothetical protein
LDEVAVQRELTDQGVDLAQAQRHLRPPLQIAAHKAVLTDADFQGRGAGIVVGQGRKTGKVRGCSSDRFIVRLQD